MIFTQLYPYEGILYHSITHNFYNSILKLCLEYNQVIQLNNTTINSNSVWFGCVIGILIIALIIFVLIYLYQRKQFKKILEIDGINDFLKEQELQAAYKLISIQDKETSKIFSDIHDSLGSMLVALNMYAESLTKSNKENLKEISTKISDASNQAGEIVRKISDALDQELIKQFALEQALINLMSAVEGQRGIKVRFELQLDNAIPNELAFHVYHMIQELVKNSLSHSKCTQINLDVQSNSEVTIIYEDNGIGFDQSIDFPGDGLKNLELQIEKLNGELKIDSKSERGSTFIIELPTK